MERGEQVAEALAWISARLDELGVPFQVAGGLAAIAHGASRPLNDIDIYVPEGSLSAIRAKLADHHSHGPERYRDEQWDCYLMSTGGESVKKWTASTWTNSPTTDVASPRRRARASNVTG